MGRHPKMKVMMHKTFLSPPVRAIFHAHLLERVLEGAYSSRVCPSSLDPAQRDSILFYDKDLCGDMEDELGEYT